MTRLVTTIQHWLELEESLADRLEAERALGIVFGFVPLASPSAAFLGRVMAEVKRPRDFFSLRWVQTAVAASLAFLTLALAMLPVSLMVLGKNLGLAALVEGASRGLLGLSGGIVRGLSVWQGLAGLGEAASLVAASPAGIWTLAIVTILLGCSVLLLRELVAQSPEMAS